VADILRALEDEVSSLVRDVSLEEEGRTAPSFGHVLLVKSQAPFLHEVRRVRVSGSALARGVRAQGGRESGMHPASLSESPNETTRLKRDRLVVVTMPRCFE